MPTRPIRIHDRELPLPERIYRFAEGAMALKELEHMGRTSSGPLNERTDALAEHIVIVHNDGIYRCVVCFNNDFRIAVVERDRTRDVNARRNRGNADELGQVDILRWISLIVSLMKVKMVVLTSL